MGTDIPKGLCRCGCGQDTKIATETKRSVGHVKGEPLRFVHNHHGRVPIEERFWNNVAIAGPEDCWEWQRSTYRGGYGQLRERGKMRKAHRVAWELANGQRIGSSDIYVCHHCDNPPCCNPAHLFLGDAQINGQDHADKGLNWLQKPAALPASAKLNPDLVRQARREVAQGATYVAIGARLGVSAHAVSEAVRGRTWAFVMDS